jgi:hypothetical protein
MSFVFDILNVLTEQETDAVKRMHLSDKENEVLHLLLKERQKPEPENEQVCRQLDISDAHYNKIKSKLLDKILTGLGGASPSGIINFIASKRTLPAILQREILQQEKNLVKAGADKVERHAYYTNCFERYIMVPAKVFNHEFAEELAGKILSISRNKAIDNFEINAGLALVKLNMLAAKGGAHVWAVEQNIPSMLEKLQKDAEKLNTYLSRYRIKHLFGFYYQIISDIPKSLAQYEKILLLLDEKGCDLPERMRLKARLKHAEALYFLNRYDEAFTRYQNLLNDYIDILRDDVYTKSKFIQVAIITRNYDTAETLLDKYMKHYLQAKGGNSHVMAALCYTKLYLCKGDYNSASPYLDLLRKELNKTVYVQYEIELRNLENAYFFLTGDYVFARTLSKKNIKFLASKGFNMHNSGYAYFFHLINAFYNLHQSGKKLNKEQQKMMDYCQDGSWKIYGILLQQMHNKALAFK